MATWVDLVVVSSQPHDLQSCIADTLHYEGFGEIKVPSGSEMTFSFRFEDPVTHQQ
ncbi:unnamed protein product, partial [Effrenium voratum]